jgi:hypothetical protein
MVDRIHPLRKIACFRCQIPKNAQFDALLKCDPERLNSSKIVINDKKVQKFLSTKDLSELKNVLVIFFREISLD